MYELENRIEQIKLAREGAEVSRTHTLRHIGDHLVGQHSFNMLAMLRILWPNAPIALVWAILEHDIPERLMGDMPAPAKWFGIINKDAETQMEREINKAIFGGNHSDLISTDHQKWLKGLDILELYMWSRDQIRLGNSGMKTMLHRIERFIEGNQVLFADEVIDLYFETKADSWELMPDLGDV